MRSSYPTRLLRAGERHVPPREVQASSRLRQRLLKGIPERVTMRLERVEHIGSRESSRIVGAEGHHRISPRNGLIIARLVLGELFRVHLSAHFPGVAEDAERLKSRSGSLRQLQLEIPDLRLRTFLVLAELQSPVIDVPLQRGPSLLQVSG